MQLILARVIKELFMYSMGEGNAVRIVDNLQELKDLDEDNIFLKYLADDLLSQFDDVEYVLRIRKDLRSGNMPKTARIIVNLFDDIDKKIHGTTTPPKPEAPPTKKMKVERIEKKVEKKILEAIEEIEQYEDEIKHLAKEIQKKKRKKKRFYSIESLVRCMMICELKNIPMFPLSKAIYENEKIRNKLGFVYVKNDRAILDALGNLPYWSYTEKIWDIIGKGNTIEKVKKYAVELWIKEYLSYGKIAEKVSREFKMQITGDVVKRWVNEYLKKNLRNFTQKEIYRFVRRKIIEKARRGKNVNNIIEEIEKEINYKAEIRTVITWIKQKRLLRECLNTIKKMYDEGKDIKEIAEWFEEKYGYKKMYPEFIEDEMLRMKIEGYR